MRSDSVIELEGKGRFGSEIATSPRSEPGQRSLKRVELFLESAWATIAETEREQRKVDANLLTAAKQGNKSFIIKGRGSSVVEQPIRNRNLPQRKQTEPTYT